MRSPRSERRSRDPLRPFEARTNDVSTVWQYTSAEATKGDAPESSPCTGDVVGGNTAACRPEPLIFLRYDFDLALDNTVGAGETHEITVVGYYQESLGALPEVTSLKAETTFGGGRTWRPAATRSTGKNTFTTTIRNPRPDQAAKGVGLRISATDSQGNTVRQTLPTAPVPACSAGRRTMSRSNRGKASPCALIFPGIGVCHSLNVWTCHFRHSLDAVNFATHSGSHIGKWLPRYEYAKDGGAVKRTQSQRYPGRHSAAARCAVSAPATLLVGRSPM
ncbi:hypothetical protein ACFYXS_26720 [Streptomyces sp. NPDC002574]|uniref:hypothetical protein n=1 Tax=Streptomyces sp. NPDC002574 TaxID=3364652 RepID=UPI00367903EB